MLGAAQSVPRHQVWAGYAHADSLLYSSLVSLVSMANSSLAS